jgi:predicted molibdopterin-dependent oxidoreductase YjgC
MMGTCQQCLVRVDGRLAQACITPVRAGMVVEPA